MTNDTQLMLKQKHQFTKEAKNVHTNKLCEYAL